MSVKIHHNTISDKKLCSSSFLLAPGFLYTNICLKKICYAEELDDALLRLEKNFAYEGYGEELGLYMKSKLFLVIEKCICLIILFVNSDSVNISFLKCICFIA